MVSTTVLEVWVPNRMLPKLMLAGFAVMRPPMTAHPKSVMVNEGCRGAVLETAIVALADPLALGVNSTTMCSVWPAGIVAGNLG